MQTYEALGYLCTSHGLFDWALSKLSVVGARTWCLHSAVAA